MRKLHSFISLSLDGYFARENGDMSWSHRRDPEFQSFVAKNAQSGGCLLFGRTTYDMMASFWPTPQAKEQMPAVAAGINAAPKFVVSRRLEQATWQNTTILSRELATEVTRLKREAPADIAILGSGSLVAQLAELGLIDEFQVVLVPVALGAGRTLFAGMKRDLALKLTESRLFENGNVFLRYVPG